MVKLNVPKLLVENSFLHCITFSGQKVSPDGKTKVQLQVILLTGESNVFHFAYSVSNTSSMVNFC